MTVVRAVDKSIFFEIAIPENPVTAENKKLFFAPISTALQVEPNLIRFPAHPGGAFRR
jgi:hypothetical protein